MRLMTLSVFSINFFRQVRPDGIGIFFYYGKIICGSVIFLMLGGWLDLVLMYSGWLLGFLQGLYKPIFRLDTTSRMVVKCPGILRILFSALNFDPLPPKHCCFLGEVHAIMEKLHLQKSLKCPIDVIALFNWAVGACKTEVKRFRGVYITLVF